MDERPTRRAAAISGGETPRIVAKGYGALAEQVIAEARQHGIHVHDSPELVDLLMGLDLDERIPERWYSVVSELLVWAHEQDGSEDSH